METKKTNSKIRWIIAGILLLNILAALKFTESFIRIVTHRIPYPFELEWLEGIGVEHVIRSVQGLPFYVKPSVDFISLVYTPIYFLLSSIPSHFGAEPGFWFGRLLSVLFVIGTALIIYNIVQKQTENPAWALLIALLIPASYKACGAWYDLMKADTMQVFLVMVGGWMLNDEKDKPARAALAGLVFALSFFVKQTALFFCIAAGLYVLICRRKILIPFATAGLGGSIIGLVLCQYVFFGKWFWFYTFTIPRSQPTALPMIWVFPVADVLIMAGPLLLAGIVGWVSSKKEKGLCQVEKMALFIAAGGFVAGYMGRLHWGGFENSRYYFYAPLFLLVGLFAGRIMPRLSIKNNLSGSARKSYASLLILVFMAIELFLFRFSAETFIPTTKDIKTGKKIVQTLSRIDGDVLVLNHGYYSYLAGKKIHAHAYFIEYLHHMKDPRGDVATPLMESIVNREYGAIVLGDQPGGRGLIEPYYRYASRLIPDKSTFGRYKTGNPQLPTQLYLPKQEPEAASLNK